MNMCLNWKVLVGLAAVAAGILFVMLGLLPGALPILLVAVCPLSMLVMAVGMGKMNVPARDQSSTQPSFSRESAVTFEDKTTQLRRELANLDAWRAEVAATLHAQETSSVAPQSIVDNVRANRESHSVGVNAHLRSTE